MQPRPDRVAALLRPLAALLALALLAACGGNAAPAAGPYPAFAEYEGREVHDVEFVGELEIPRDSLNRVVTTRGTSCQLLLLPVCPFGLGRREYALDLEVLARDVVRIQLLYRDQGYYGTRVVPTVEEVDEERVDVRFAVVPGDRVVTRTVRVTGADSIIPEARMLERVPLKEGEPFRRIEFLASVDTVRNALLAEGHAYAQVLRNYSIDTIADVADVELAAAPGPVVTVDTILFVGNDRLTERTARQQLAVREGRRLRSTDLIRSQRNLFDLELVQYATVEVAPESLQVTPDSAQLLSATDSIGTTVLVRIVEAPRYAVDASAGYGTVDCLRGGISHVDRNFLGAARRLEASASVSKVGVGGPTAAGLENTFLCDEFKLDSLSSPEDTVISDAINYRLALDFLQPRFFGTRTSVGAGVFTERISELGLYLRDRHGGQVGFVRQVAPATIFSTTFTLERGRTQASDLFFCVAYEVCSPEDIEPLERSRWSNSLSLGLIRNRVRLNPFPTAGYQVRLGTDYASPLVGSDDTYLRVLGDATWYREMGRNTVLSLRVLGGSFLTDTDGEFIPPERRFYAGGPTSVRGFGRNELGPTVYLLRIPRVDPDDPPDEKNDKEITRSATGGTRTLVGTAEVTAPSPFLRDYLRVAAFLDAGQVWAPSNATVELSRPGLRFTPGIGARVATPVGPLRLDFAYNPYPRETGPLLIVDPSGNIGDRPVIEEYRPADGRSFLQRVTVHLSVGQTF